MQGLVSRRTLARTVLLFTSDMRKARSMHRRSTVAGRRDWLSSHLLLSEGLGRSGRYWLAEGYAARHAAGQEPQSIDKEVLRLWFRANCDPYGDAVRVCRRSGRARHPPASQ